MSSWIWRCFDDNEGVYKLVAKNVHERSKLDSDKEEKDNDSDANPPLKLKSLQNAF